jgi:hypothetical protein
MPSETKKPYLVCSHCQTKVEESQVIKSHTRFTDAWNDLITNMAESRGEAPPPALDYHRVWYSVGAGGGMIGCHMESRLCGPLREENDEDRAEEHLLDWLALNESR